MVFIQNGRVYANILNKKEQIKRTQEKRVEQAINKIEKDRLKEGYVKEGDKLVKANNGDRTEITLDRKLGTISTAITTQTNQTQTTNNVPKINVTELKTQKLAEGYKEEGNKLVKTDTWSYKSNSGKKSEKELPVEEIIINGDQVTIKKYDVFYNSNGKPKAEVKKEEVYNKGDLVLKEKIYYDSKGNKKERVTTDYVKGVEKTKNYTSKSGKEEVKTIFEQTGQGEGLILTPKSTGVSTIYDVSSGFDKPKEILTAKLPTTSIKQINVNNNQVELISKDKTQTEQIKDIAKDIVTTKTGNVSKAYELQTKLEKAMPSKIGQYYYDKKTGKVMAYDTGNAILTRDYINKDKSPLIDERKFVDKYNTENGFVIDKKTGKVLGWNDPETKQTIPIQELRKYEKGQNNIRRFIDTLKDPSRTNVGSDSIQHSTTVVNKSGVLDELDKRLAEKVKAYEEANKKYGNHLIVIAARKELEKASDNIGYMPEKELNQVKLIYDKNGFPVFAVQKEKIKDGQIAQTVGYTAETLAQMPLRLADENVRFYANKNPTAQETISGLKTIGYTSVLAPGILVYDSITGGYRVVKKGSEEYKEIVANPKKRGEFIAETILTGSMALGAKRGSKEILNDLTTKAIKGKKQNVDIAVIIDKNVRNKKEPFAYLKARARDPKIKEILKEFEKTKNANKIVKNSEAIIIRTVNKGERVPKNTVAKSQDLVAIAIPKKGYTIKGKYTGTHATTTWFKDSITVAKSKKEVKTAGNVNRIEDPGLYMSSGKRGNTFYLRLEDYNKLYERNRITLNPFENYLRKPIENKPNIVMVHFDKIRRRS